MASRNLSPVRALTRELVPIVGSAAFGGAYGKETLHMARHSPGGLCDTILEAHTAGLSGITVRLVGDAADSAGVSITRSTAAFTIHYEDGVSTVGDVETAVTALAGGDDLIDVKTAGTGATVLTAAAAFAFVGMEANPAVLTAKKGEGFSITQTDIGAFLVTFTDKFADLIDFKPTLQMVDGSQAGMCQVGSIDLSAKTVVVRVMNGSGAALDPAVDDNNRLNFVAWFRNSAALPLRG